MNEFSIGSFVGQVFVMSQLNY